jgi:outer membrane protein
MNPFNVKFPTSCCVLGLALMWGSAASAQDGGMYKRGDFVVAVSASEVLTSEQLDEVSVGGGDLPGAGVTINNDETVTFDLSYFLSDRIAVNLFGGIPASARLQGTGSIGGLALGSTDYGPAVLSLQYHQPIGSNVSLYAGGGVARLLFLNEKDGAIAEFDVRDTWAPALQVGTRVALNSSLLLNLDTRYIPFNGNISGNLGPARVKAKVGVDPIVVNLGLAYRF